MRWIGGWICAGVLLVSVSGCATASRRTDCYGTSTDCPAESQALLSSLSRDDSRLGAGGERPVGAGTEREYGPPPQPPRDWQRTSQATSAQAEDRTVVVAQRKLVPKPGILPAPVVSAFDRRPEISDEAEEIPAGPSTLTLEAVLGSVYRSYPLLLVAAEQRTIAEGQLLEANAEFDLKLKGGGTTGPMGYYQTNRFGTGIEQALFGGGEVFAGYRIGRGNFQPWYGERETNDGGEFKAGFQIPLLQNRHIDDRRAAIFRAALGRDAVEPEILVQLIDFVREASAAYWDWLAAGLVEKIEQDLLDIALQRQEGLKKRVDRGDLPRIELTDNERLIASRRAALIDAHRKSRQNAIKLSLFFRTPDGQPALPPPDSLPGGFPDPKYYDDQQMEADIQEALASRPEIQYYDFVREQLEVDLAQARNLYLPEVNGAVTASQDVGAAASALRDKTPFELEASLLFSVPLQRRKALGKMQVTEGKLAQVNRKAQFARDKIATDVQNAAAALKAAHDRITQTRESVTLNNTMEEAERKRFDAGDSNLLTVNLREQATADARKALVVSLLEYFQAEADFRAAMATIPVPDSEP